MKTTPAIGDVAWFRARAGLGVPWSRGTVIAVVNGGRLFDFRDGPHGNVYSDVPFSRVRMEDPRKHATETRRPVAPLAATVERTPSTKRSRGTRVPKVLPLRSSDYLAYVRLQRCARCRTADRPRQAHHMRGPRGTGTKTDDLQAVALCAECHGKTHGGRPSLAAPSEVDAVRAELALREEQVATLIGWLRLKLVSDTR